MNFLLIESFDAYNGIAANVGLQSRWILGSTTGFSIVAGRFGGQALKCGPAVSASSYGQVALSAPTAQGTAHFAMNFETMPTADAVPCQQFQLGSGLTKTVGIRVGPDGSIRLHRAAGTDMHTSGAQLASSPAGKIVAGGYNTFQLEFVISDTVGRLSLYMNGDPTPVVEAVNVDTNNAVGTVNTAYCGATYGSGTPGTFTVDDLFVTDTAARIGERRIEPMPLIADTATKNFVPSTGVVNYAMVDDTTVNAADYVSGSNVGDLDLYQLGPLSSTPAAIDAVQVVIFGQKTDATTRAAAAVLDISGTQSQSADFYLTGAGARYNLIFQNKPGGGAWSPAALGSLFAGPKVTV